MSNILGIFFIEFIFNHFPTYFNGKKSYVILFSIIIMKVEREFNFIILKGVSPHKRVILTAKYVSFIVDGGPFTSIQNTPCYSHLLPLSKKNLHTKREKVVKK